MLTFETNIPLAANLNPVQTSNPLVVATSCPLYDFINKALILMGASRFEEFHFYQVLLLSLQRHE